ncbi:MAG: hypothetical protein ACJASX_001528 [Limisphaerales bacterium]|jgi:hypothetical protein
MKPVAIFCSLLLLTAVAPLRSAEIVSGPKPGTSLTPVKVYDGLGAFAGKEFDAAAEIGDNPGALLFVHTATRNTYPVIQGLDQLAGRNALLGFKSFTVYLSADRTSAENQIRLRNGLATGGHKFSVTGKFGALKLENPIMLSLDGVDGPGNFALNRRAVLTLVMTRNGKVHSSHTFTDTGEQDLPLLEKLVAEVIGPALTDLAKQRKLRDTRLPKGKEQLRKLAVQFQAFWGREFRRGHPMLPVVEELTGPLPTTEAALAEVIKGRLPADPKDLREMARRQAEELFHLQTRLNAAKSGRLRYTTMKTSQIQQSMRGPAMSSNGKQGRGRPTSRPQRRPAGKATVVEKPKGKPPTDPQFNQLMRSFIRQTNTPEINAEIFQDIKKRSAESAELRKEAIAMFQFLLAADRYGNANARGFATRFLTDQSR